MVIRCAFQADLILAGNGHGVSEPLPIFDLQRIIWRVYSESLWVSLLLTIFVGVLGLVLGLD